MTTPNVFVEWLPFVIRIREVPDSILGPGDGLSSLRFFKIFLSPSRRDNTSKLGHNCFLPNPFQNLYHHPLTIDAIYESIY
jgi:hypothetical protein